MPTKAEVLTRLYPCVSTVNAEPDQTPRPNDTSVHTLENLDGRTNPDGPRILTWDDFLALPQDDRPWLVQDLARPGWLIALLGHGKEGKTTLALHLLASLGAQAKWMERNIPQAKPTLYLGFE